jgi:exosortase
MSSAEVPILSPALRWHRATVAEWDALESRTQTRCKVATLVVVVVIAYHYSLVSLLQTIGLDTPLAYVGLVPLLAAGLAWINRAPRASELPIHDRELDYGIGLVFIAVAVIGGVVLPSRLGAMFWVNRLDLLFLPLFVTGATVLLFGLRVAWRQKVPLAYLFLGWPWLYTTFLLGTLGGFTSMTLRGENGALDVVHVAIPVANDPGVFEVVHAGQATSISVVTACSGIDGMVGFLLIGVALASIVSGPLLRKALWLATGLVLLWITNLARLLLIFWAGKEVGPHFALGILHPVAGLVMFCIGVGLMSALLRPFGLSRVKAAPPVSTSMVRSATPRVFAAVGILLAAAVVLSVSDAELQTFNPVAAASGEPKLGSFLADPANPVGWTAAFETEYTFAKPLFGQDSRWFRYLYSPTSPGRSALHSTLPVTADVIDAGSLDGFDAYGVTACYSFHGYTLRDVANVDLGDGINGQALSYSGITARQNWSIVYWIWPVETGAGTRYERVILYLQNTSWAAATLAPHSPGAAQLAQAIKGVDPAQRLLLTNRAFLVAFARQVVAGQTRQRDTDVLIDAVQTPDHAVPSWDASSSSSSQHAGTASSTAAASGPYETFWQTYRHEHPRPSSSVSSARP